MKLIIAGGRLFNNESLMREALSELLATDEIPVDVEGVFGMARGADIIGYNIFKEIGLPVHEFHANWSTRAGGILRNEDMGRFADKALCFWDGQSRGTKHMISFMKKLNKPCFVVRY